jgi:hypothetical protein
VMADQRKARKLIDHVLVVVGDNDFHECWNSCVSPRC